MRSGAGYGGELEGYVENHLSRVAFASGFNQGCDPNSYPYHVGRQWHCLSRRFRLCRQEMKR
jgi:hypothetical protein